MFDRVKELSKKRGTTIEGMLNSAGEISLNTYNGWKKRRILPRVDECYAIAKALGTTVEYLLTGENGLSDSPEAKAVNESEELKALVRAVMRDPQLLQVISAVVKSSEKTLGNKQA